MGHVCPKVFGHSGYVIIILASQVGIIKRLYTKMLSSTALLWTYLFLRKKAGMSNSSTISTPSGISLSSKYLLIFWLSMAGVSVLVRSVVEMEAEVGGG